MECNMDVRWFYFMKITPSSLLPHTKGIVWCAIHEGSWTPYGYYVIAFINIGFILNLPCHKFLQVFRYMIRYIL